MRVLGLFILFIVSPVSADSDWDRMSKDFQKLKDPRYSGWLAGSLVAGGLLKHWDESYDYHVGFGRLDPVARKFDDFSDPVIMFTFASGFRLFTKLNHVSALDTTSSDLLRSIILANSLVAPLKLIFNRKRPENNGNFSFPSGHAANIAAVTTIVVRNYSWVYRLGAFAASGMVFSSRITDRRHHFSDVVSGAAIGSLAGWICSRKEFSSSVYATFSFDRTSMFNLVWSIST
tara:strand:- start:174 stop:869 length:696 start_codon:yes stop_codon:yes gene_type:complete